MELSLKRIAVILLNATMSDQELKEQLLFVKEYGVRMVIVLPMHVSRAKRLLEGTNIKIGSLIDYPFGMGTYAKQAFETGRLFQDGASDIFLTMPEEYLADAMYDGVYEQLLPLTFGRGDMGLFFKTYLMSEEERSYLAFRLTTEKAKKVILGMDLPIERAIYDMGLFRAIKGKQLQFFVSVKDPTLLELELLFQAGASVIGISNPLELLPLLSKA